jgi:hypothetical protein
MSSCFVTRPADEVFMVRRHHAVAFMAGAHVFPADASTTPIFGGHHVV